MRIALVAAVVLVVSATECQAQKSAYSGTVAVNGRNVPLVLTAEKANALYTGKGGDNGNPADVVIAAASLQELPAGPGRIHGVYLTITVARPNRQAGGDTARYFADPPIGGALTLKLDQANGAVAWPASISMTPGTAP